MRIAFTWQQFCRSAATVCLVAFIVVHSLVQQRSPLASPGTPGQQLTPAFVQPWTLLSAQRSFAQFEAGMIFPRWGASAYGKYDANWLAGLREIQAQSGARWVAITIALHQTGQSATRVSTSSDTPTPQSLAEGIHAAKRLGYRVFIIPMISLNATPQWSGYIHFTTLPQAQSWFDSYWQTIQPYVIAAQQEGAEQFSLGNELEQLQAAPTLLWQGLLERISHVFTGAIVYDMNWTSLQKPVALWMRDKRIATIGVSTYIPLTAQPQRLDAQQLPTLWHNKVETALDNFSEQLRKPVFLSELGYRDAAFAGYKPWLIEANDSRDDGEQALLFEAALQNIAADMHINGVFIWAWSFPPFAPNGKAAAQVLRQWFSMIA